MVSAVSSYLQLPTAIPLSSSYSWHYSQFSSVDEDVDEIFKPFRNLGLFPAPLPPKTAVLSSLLLQREKVNPTFKMPEEQYSKMFHRAGI